MVAMSELSVVFQPGRFGKFALYGVVLAVVFSIAAWLCRDRRLDKMPGPRGWPLVGIGLSLPPRAPSVFREWGAKYGEVFKLRVGYHNWVVINSPEAFRQIIDKQSNITSSKKPAPMGDDIVSYGMRMFTLPYGPKWRTYRSIVHRLLSTTMTNTFIPTQEYETKQLLFDLAKNNSNQRDFYQHLRRFSFSIVMTSTYGTRVNQWDHPDVHASERSTGILGRITGAGAFVVDELPILAQLPLWLQPGLKRARAAGKDLLEGKMRLWRRLIAQLAAKKAPICYARDMLENSDTWRKQGLIDEDSAWIAGGLVEVGSHTTSVSLLHTILLLAAYPRAQRVAHDELMRVVGPDRSPTYADIQDLPYIRAIVKEVLRLRPTPVWGIRHYADADVTYKNYVIPKGTVLLANTSFIHYDPSRYDEPFEFRPERYLDHPHYSAEYLSQSDPYQRDHFSFGGGRRVCPGTRLAENSLHMALAGILWAFEIRPPLLEESGDEAPGMDLREDEAFENTSFRAPKPFAARFVPRAEERLRLVEGQWEKAKKEGYVLRGNEVDLNGVVIY